MQLICSGTGGQGVLTLGSIIASIATDEDMHVTWVPSYGSEMRGGASNCVVKVSDEQIISPYVTNPDVFVALAPRAFGDHKEKLRKSGCVIVNSSIIKDDEICVSADIPIIKIAANEIAAHNNAPRGMNLVLVGAVIARTGFVDKESAVEGIRGYFGKKGKTIDSNSIDAFIEGYETALNYQS